MPILQREPDRFPDSILEDPPADQWWVLYTIARREKDLMRKMYAMQVPFYGPVMTQRRRSPAGRIRTSFVPVFGGYVFLNGDEDSRQAALKTNCVSRVVTVKDVTRFVGELQTLDHILQSGLHVTREDRLVPGERIRVVSGPLKGAEGTLLHQKGHQRICVMIDFLQQGVSVDLDECDIQAV